MITYTSEIRKLNLTIPATINCCNPSKMTLLGKLFRPWDLSTEENPMIPTENVATNPKDVIPGDVNAGKSNGINKNTTTDEVQRRNHMKIKRKVKPNDAIVKKYRHRVEASESSSSNPHVNSRHSSTTEVGIGNEIRARLERHDPCSSGHTVPPINCCEPISPADFTDLVHLQNCSCSSASPFSKPENIFMYPSTINELASLSRTELTAMGLLPMESMNSMKARRQRPKKFHCPHCQVAFSNNGQLRGHIRIHTGERPYECEEEGCGKSFTRNEELTRHRRIHSGLRPFPCSYCGKKFGRKDHLKKHTRTHQRGMFGSGPSLIGYGNPFHGSFHPPLGPTSGFASSNDLLAIQSSFLPPPPHYSAYPL